MNERSLQSAMKYAAKLGKSLLAESISEMCGQRCSIRHESQPQSFISSRYSEKSMQETTLLSLPSQGTQPLSSTLTSESRAEEDDIIEATPSGLLPREANSSNPLLFAASRRSRYALPLDSSISPSEANPFRKAASNVSSNMDQRNAKKALEVLDEYRPKKTNSAPILRPLLKKKSKTERKNVGETSQSSCQPTLESKFSNLVPPSDGKENRTDANHSLKNNVKINESNVEVNGFGVSVRTSPMFKTTSAMYLWWADNEELVNEQIPGTNDFKKLLPKAAILFKDLADEVKMKYKKLAAENSSQEPSPEAKRKRSEDCQDDGGELKKSRANSTSEKLAAFAFKGTA
ncbi:uncharacterized protein LOC108669273 [Hyalella azteca]|uniref:Uncharacterized protein LOC108669273 n=1 Tax=Hyalella azteca TaxID=294128 RepID=A0A8B7NEL6_HYAAZ|nr:uncharacterized protein LOC108669273 [Hyalella azteca]